MGRPHPPPSKNDCTVHPPHVRKYFITKQCLRKVRLALISTVAYVFFSFEHVKFTCINEIQVMYGRPRLKVKVQRGSFTFKRDLPYITSISFTRVKITQHVANAIPVLEKRNFYIEKTLSSYQNTRQS